MSVSSYTLASGEERWQWRADLPPGADGKRRQRSGMGFASREAAEAAEAKAAGRAGAALPAARGTVAAALEAWAAGGVVDLEPTTAAWYEGMVRRYIVPHVGRLDMAALDEAEITRLFGLLIRAGGAQGRSLSRSTVHGVMRTLRAALNDLGVAVDWRLVRKPALPKKTGRRGVWSPAEAAKFLASGVPGWAVLAVVGGLRRGELAGLCWRDVDREAGLIRVRVQRTLVEGGGAVEKDPKGTSAREVPVGPATLAALGPAGAAGARVFGDRHPSYFTHVWPRLCAAAGVPRIALHDARHTSATLGSVAGIDIKTMQARLGHAEPDILTAVYLHAVTEAGRTAAVTLEQALGLAA